MQQVPRGIDNLSIRHTCTKILVCYYCVHCLYKDVLTPTLYEGVAAPPACHGESLDPAQDSIAHTAG